MDKDNSLNEQKEPGAGSRPLTLAEANGKWSHLSDLNLYRSIEEQRTEPYAGFYRLGRRGVTDADLLTFLSETEHLATWSSLSPDKPDYRLDRLSNGPPHTLSGRLSGRRPVSPYSVTETIALALRNGKPTDEGDLGDFMLGRQDHAEALQRRASLAAAQDGGAELAKAPEPDAKPKSKTKTKTATAAIVRAAINHDKLRPTEEQASAVSAFATGGSLKIIAGAGTGKTSTLKLIGESTAKRGVYIAFNTAMADDAKRRMPQNVSASTAHSLAFRGVDQGFGSKIRQRLPASMAAEAGGVRGMLALPGKSKDGDDLVISKSTAGYFMLDWVRRHCMSADARITAESAPAGRMLGIMGIDRDEAGPDDWKRAKEIAGALLPATEKLWGRMSNPRDPLPATHDTYLKVWALSNPKIEADFILFDEAQDANALMLQIVGSQSAQKVYVGDPNQQIYAWRGAVNAMRSIKTDLEAKLTESFRFGPEIAEFANLALELCQSDMRMTGKAAPGRDFGRDGKPQTATLCRTNAAVVGQLMAAPDISRAHVAGGVSQIVGTLNGMRELRDQDRTSNPELVHFKSWQELVSHADAESDDLSALFKLTKAGQNIESLTALLEKTSRIALPGSHVISTVHKCKGLEWADVRLADDFRTPEHKRWSSEEANLLYVAGTRAMRSLRLGDEFAAKLHSKAKTTYSEIGANELEQKKHEHRTDERERGQDKSASGAERPRKIPKRGWPFPTQGDVALGR